MAAFNMHQAKTHFSELVERVQAVEEIVIAKSGKPVVPPGECGTLPADQCPRLSKTS